MGEELPEAVYRGPLAETKDAIKTVKEPMKSESEDVQVFTVDAFMKLSNLAAIAEALGREPERERSPLSRRSIGGEKGVP